MRRTAIVAWVYTAPTHIFRNNRSAPLCTPLRTVVSCRSLSEHDRTYLFQTSPFQDARTKRRHTTASNATGETDTTKPDVQPGTFGSHDQLVHELKQLTNDPLEIDGGRIVVHRGSTEAKLVIVGEAPGEQEDLHGKPFVGPAGQLLDKIFTYGGFDMERQVYVTNICKRRPKANRTPSKQEVQYYMGYFEEEMRLIRPTIMVLAGAVAAQAVLGDVRITKVRGQWFEMEGIHVMPVFHPSYLLRNPVAKYDMVKDIEAIREKYMQLVPEDQLGKLEK